MTKNLPPLFDLDRALADIARARKSTDLVTVTTVRLADDLAVNVARHFAAGDLETAGRAMVLGACSAQAIAQRANDKVAIVTLNLVAFAGQKLVTDFTP